MKIKNDKHVYSIFGLIIETPLRFLELSETQGKPDVVISFGNPPGEISGAAFRGPRFQASASEFLLRVESVARFYVASGSSIVIEPAPDAVERQVLLYLMGSAMGALLHQRKILPLHAGCVEIDGKCVLFTGPSGIGKSSLVAGFHERDARILADDVCALQIDENGRPFVMPGFSHIKLWEDSLEKIRRDPDRLPCVRPEYKKYFLSVAPSDLRPVRPDFIFRLRASDSLGFRAVEYYGMEKILPIIKNTYRFHFLKGIGGKADHFKTCALVAKHAAVQTITRPKTPFLLAPLMDFIESRLKESGESHL